MGQNPSLSENTDTRVLLLEHDSLATKLKFLEDNLDKKLESLKVNLEKKLEKSEKSLKENQNKHMEYVDDKIYEMKSKLRNLSYSPSHSECDRRINKVIKEQDCFDVKLNKVKENFNEQESISSKIVPQIELLQEKFLNLENVVKEKLYTPPGTPPLTSSFTEENDDNLSIIFSPLKMAAHYTGRQL